MAKKIVTLYIEDTSIRLLVTSGRKIKKWVDVPLQPGLVKNAVILREAEVATKIMQILKAQKVKDNKVVVGISGLHCLSRPIILPQLPRDMLNEAVRREAKRLLPVPLEQLYLSWGPISSPEGKTQVFLVAIPTKSADALFKMLHQAGLKTQLMDIKPLLLARVVRDKTAIIVDVQPTEFDIVIMAEGIPQPIRTVSLPGESLVWQEKLPLIREELVRTIKFFDSNNPEKPLLSSVSVFVSGALADEPDLCQALSDDLGHPVFILPSPLPVPEGLDPNRYMVNIGLVLKELAWESRPVPLVTNLNILPIPYRPKPISLPRVIAPPAMAIAVGLLAFMVMIIQNASANVAQIHGQLDTTTQLIQQKLQQAQDLKNKIAELEKKIANAETSGKNFIAAVDSIESQKTSLNVNLDTAVKKVPAGVNLTVISQSKGTLTIKGRALSEKEVLSYLESLDASNRFSEITITSLSKVEDAMDFTLSLKSGG